MIISENGQSKLYSVLVAIMEAYPNVVIIEFCLTPLKVFYFFVIFICSKFCTSMTLFRIFALNAEK